MHAPWKHTEASRLSDDLKESDGLRPDRRAAPDQGDRARVHRQRDRAAVARKRAQPPLRPGDGQEGRRPGLPRRDRAAGVRRRGPRLLQLRPGRRGDRPRRLVDPHGDLGADLARVLGHPQVRHRGAEAEVPAEAVLGRVARLLRADRAGHRLRRRQPEDARAQDRLRLGDQRREDVDLDGQLRQGRADLRADRPGARAQGHRLLPRRHRPARLHGADDRAQDGPARLRHRLDLARRRRGLRRGHARRGRRRLQNRDVEPRLRALLGGGRLRRHLPGLRRGVGQRTPRSASSSADRSRASSSCRR